MFFTGYETLKTMVRGHVSSITMFAYNGFSGHLSFP